MADTTLQHCVLVGDRASGLADCGSTSLFHERGAGECVQTSGGSCFSALLGKSMPGGGECVC